jgi:acetylornithine deacetylase/succinyl-diaminopimelate desuccinylase-like protein
MPMADARAAVLDMVRGLAARFPDYGIESEIYVTAPGSEIAEGHELVQAIDASHSEVFGRAAERDTVRWFSDASALTRYGIETVNYGTSSGLPGAEGEALEIKGLVDTAKVYALAAARLCGVA